MDNKRSSSTDTLKSRPRIGTLAAIMGVIIIIPQISGSLTAIAAGMAGYRYYISGTRDYMMDGLYAGTNCLIYKDALTVTDVRPSPIDTWSDAFARSYNLTMQLSLFGIVKTQCGVLSDPDSSLLNIENMEG